MPKISKEKIKKIEEQILYYLYSIFPRSVYTFDISKEIARDEEFIKSLLLKMEKEYLILKITKNNEGINYERRIRWRISNKAFEAYKKVQ